MSNIIEGTPGQLKYVAVLGIHAPEIVIAQIPLHRLAEAIAEHETLRQTLSLRGRHAYISEVHDEEADAVEDLIRQLKQYPEGLHAYPKNIKEKMTTFAGLA